MGNVAIVTDSNSGISQAEGKELGIYVIPMPFLVDGKLYFEDVDMNKEQFYHFLENDADLSTSQPSPGDVMDLWDKLLKEYDEIINLSKTELEILRLFVKSEGIVLTREQILNSIWGSSQVVSDRTIDAHICKIRKKLNLTCLKSASGYGYVLKSKGI